MGGGLPSLNYFFTNYIKYTGLCMLSGVGDESLEADSRQLLQQQHGQMVKHPLFRPPDCACLAGVGDESGSRLTPTFTAAAWPGGKAPAS